MKELLDYQIGGDPGAVLDEFRPWRNVVVELPIIASGQSEWVRFRFGDYPTARRVQSNLATTNDGWDGTALDRSKERIRTRIEIDSEGGCCYLWVRRLSL